MTISAIFADNLLIHPELSFVNSKSAIFADKIIILIYLHLFYLKHNKREVDMEFLIIAFMLGFLVGGSLAQWLSIRDINKLQRILKG